MDERQHDHGACGAGADGPVERIRADENLTSADRGKGWKDRPLPLVPALMSQVFAALVAKLWAEHGAKWPLPIGTGALSRSVECDYLP